MKRTLQEKRPRVGVAGDSSSTKQSAAGAPRVFMVTANGRLQHTGSQSMPLVYQLLEAQNEREAHEYGMKNAARALLAFALVEPPPGKPVLDFEVSVTELDTTASSGAR